ncbi:Ig-like domain-containing protein [Fictibacillus sp. B-59209]|uniref:Ig-like domain-containing protein n=1 Tax=Fictibacillus sp. B-59209 TaxID=3024873 RepID=UPI002E23E27C|nr:Ig-like domain-containing protein [Fictibacillus sp. B-59209]
MDPLLLKLQNKKHASVVVKRGSTVLGSKKSDASGNCKITIKAQKKGTVLTVSSTDAAKNTKTVKVTVVKAK